MKIVFIGSSKFGLRCLERITAIPDCEIVGVVTAPAKFTISYRPQGVENVLHADVSNLCAVFEIPVIAVADGLKRSELLEQVRVWQPQAFVVAGWYHMIPKAWRELAPAYGLHASLLPDYSGGAPLTWAMINGEKRTGITLFRMDEGVDSGPVIGQASTEITDGDTIATLYSRVEELGLKLLSEYLPKIARGTAKPIVQDNKLRRVCPQRGPENGLIDWNRAAGQVHDFVRAQTRPYPGAFAMVSGKRLNVWATRQAEIKPENKQSGELFWIAERLFACCGDGAAVELTEYKFLDK